MNSKIFKLLVIVGLICSAGCDDFLDTTPTDKISDKIAWESEATVQLAMNTFYAYIDRYGAFANPSQFNGSLTEGLTETLKYGSYVPGSSKGDANDYVFTPEKITAAGSGSLLGVWGATYERINRVNQFLEGLGKYSKLDPAKNRLYEAQARFFRAFLYFQLAKRHDGVILYTDMNLQKDINRSSAEDTWNLIESDLNFAASVLPKPKDLSAAEAGRVTRGAAFALQSRAMLYAGRWQQAKDAADSVFAQNVYALTASYADAWKGGNSESILEYNYLLTGPNHSFDKNFATWNEISNQGGDATPTQELVEAYEKKDGTEINWTPWHAEGGTATPPPYADIEPRFHATVIYNGSQWMGKTMENSVGGENGRFMSYGSDVYTLGRTVTGYYVKKFRDESNTNLPTNLSTHTWVELRLAEVYLNRAEANFRLGRNGAALDDLNAVRARTGVNLPAKTGLTGSDLFNAIRRERKIELIYEGHLYWDMRRWRLAHTEYDGYRVHGLRISKQAEGFHYEYVDCDMQDRKFLQKTYVLPIPENELNNNSAIEQYDQWK